MSLLPAALLALLAQFTQPGVYISQPGKTCAQSISQPVTNQTVCFDSTTQLWTRWNGTAFVSISGGGASGSAVNSLTGTANQVLVSSPTGNITLSTPQNTDTAALVTFASVTATNVAAGTGFASCVGVNAHGTLFNTGAGCGGTTQTVDFPGTSCGSSPISALDPTGAATCLNLASVSSVSSVNGLTGALTITGTASQVNVNSAGTTVTLSTPQDIASNSSVNFGAVTIVSQAAGVGFSSCVQVNASGTLANAGFPCGAGGGGGGITSINGSTVPAQTITSGDGVINVATGIGGITRITTTIPLPVLDGGTGLTNGAAGGVPCFIASFTMASGAPLGLNAVVVGGGAGACPQTIALGTGGKVLHQVSPSAPTWAAVNPAVDLTSDLIPLVNLASGTANNTTFFRGDRTWQPVPQVSGGVNGQVAFFSGTTTITSDSNLKWDNTNKRLGIGTTAAQTLHVAGTGRWDTPTNVGASISIADGQILENYIVNGLYQGRTVNKTGAPFSVTGGNALPGLEVFKGGTLNSIALAAVAVNHLGSGTGDNYYSQATTTATQFSDGLYRGDLNGAGCGSDFGQPSLSCGSVFVGHIGTDSGGTGTQKGLLFNLSDSRATGSATGTMFYQTDTRSDSNPLWTIIHNASSAKTYSGNVLYVDMNFNNNTTFAGNFLVFDLHGAHKFLVDNAGKPTVSGGNSTFTGTKTVRASGGAADCTLVFTGGILTGGTC